MNETMNNDLYDAALDWECEIENDDQFIIAPEGDYDFEIVNLERGRFNGSDKICACPQATVTLHINTPDGTVSIFDRFLLHRKMEWKISGFFRSIGKKKKGEKVKINWNNLEGLTGRAHIYVDRYTDKNGNQKESNKVKFYYDQDPTKMASMAFRTPTNADEIPFNSTDNQQVSNQQTQGVQQNTQMVQGSIPQNPIEQAAQMQGNIVNNPMLNS